MKFKIITNTFQDYHRQNVAVDSWIYLKNLFDIDIIDYQFGDEEKNFEKKYIFLTTKFCLNESSQTILPNASKKLPCVSEIFNNALGEDCDYFVITNSDVIIMPRLIEYIIQNKPKAMACSRLDIEHIESFQKILDKNVRPVRWEPAGFDTFVFEKEWARQNAILFRNKYFLGKPKYDVVWAGHMKIFGDNTPLGNKYPPFCFHIHHGNSSCYLESPEKDHNENILKVDKLDCLMHNIMVLHLKQNLLKRTPWGSFLNIPDDEEKNELDFFKILDINNPNPSFL